MRGDGFSTGPRVAICRQDGREVNKGKSLNVSIHLWTLIVSKITTIRDFPGSQWLRLCTSSAEGMGSIPGGGIKMSSSQKTKPQQAEQEQSTSLHPTNSALQRVAHISPHPTALLGTRAGNSNRATAFRQREQARVIPVAVECSGPSTARPGNWQAHHLPGNKQAPSFFCTWWKVLCDKRIYLWKTPQGDWNIWDQQHFAF